MVSRANLLPNAEHMHQLSLWPDQTSALPFWFSFFYSADARRHSISYRPFQFQNSIPYPSINTLFSPWITHFTKGPVFIVSAVIKPPPFVIILYDSFIHNRIASALTTEKHKVGFWSLKFLFWKLSTFFVFWLFFCSGNLFQVYPKVRVRTDGRDDQLAHNWSSLLSLKDIQFLCLQDSCFAGTSCSLFPMPDLFSWFILNFMAKVFLFSD